MILNDALLDFWIDNNFNVKMEGRRGTGKTTMITKAFDRKFGEGKWRYFSAPTMDPWVDFVGVPEKTKSPKGNDCIRLVRPEEFADDEVYALFFDELNRAKPKVIDAVMELIQFKSINGRKFKNLRTVWCATNPHVHDGDEDEEYMVEALDPAHVDRFHIHVTTDYALNEDFFYEKFPEYAETAIAWWNNLGRKNQKMQNKVSPRRLEYALAVHQKGGSMEYVLPVGANVADLYSQLINGNYIKRMEGLHKRNNPTEIKKALLNENLYNGIKDEILKDQNLMKVFVPYFPAEKFNDLMGSNENFRKFVLNDTDVMKAGLDNLLNIVEANKGHPQIIRQIKQKLTENELYTQTPTNQVIENHYNELGDDFFNEEKRMMRFASIIQQQKHTDAIDQSNLVKTLVVTLCIIAKASLKWQSSKLGMIAIKNAANKHGISFRSLMTQAYTDPQYQKYIGNDPIYNQKIQSIIIENSLFDEPVVERQAAQMVD